ncbi:MAG: hypothetical protein ACKPBB_01810 [Sphaerospermopsis kisseleviana]
MEAANIDQAIGNSPKVTLTATTSICKNRKCNQSIQESGVRSQESEYLFVAGIYRSKFFINNQ